MRRVLSGYETTCDVCGDVIAQHPTGAVTAKPVVTPLGDSDPRSVTLTLDAVDGSPDHPGMPARSLDLCGVHAARLSDALVMRAEPIDQEATA